MMNDLLRKLRSENKIQILEGLEALEGRMPGLDGDDLASAVHAVLGLFYIDPMDHPELIPVLEQAEDLLAGLRERVIPIMLASLGESDLKVHFHLASVLGKMGYAAVAPLLRVHSDCGDDYCQVFTLYALGKIKDQKVLEALPLLLTSLDSTNREVRDTAARALGKVCENVDPQALTPSVRRELFDRLIAKASDPYAGVRSKALRSLGKMSKFGLVDDERKARLGDVLARVLGEDEEGNWDVAYIVRAEAERAKSYL